MKLNADKHHLAVLTYEIGQQVWLATENLQLTHTSQKLSERWLGLYTIIGFQAKNMIFPEVSTSFLVLDVLLEVYHDGVVLSPSTS